MLVPIVVPEKVLWAFSAVELPVVATDRACPIIRAATHAAAAARPSRAMECIALVFSKYRTKEVKKMSISLGLYEIWTVDKSSYITFVPRVPTMRHVSYPSISVAAI